MPFRQHFEPQGSGDRCRLDEAHRDGIAEPVAFPAGIADQRMGTLVVAVIVIPQRRRRNEAVGACVGQLDEQAGAGDAADAAL